MKALEWLKGLFRPKGKLGGPAGGPHPSSTSHKRDSTS